MQAASNSTNAMKSESPKSKWIGSLPHMTGLILNGGNITIGRVEPLDGIAVAADASRVLATLVRREAETIEELLRRLDTAVGQAISTRSVVSDLGDTQMVLSTPSARPRRRR
jgi:hypothetical protein